MTKVEKLLKRVRTSQIIVYCYGFISILGYLAINVVYQFRLPAWAYLVFIIFIVVSVVVVLWIKSIWRNIHDILFQGIDLDTYYQFFDAYLPKSKRGSLGYFEGLIAYLRGDFATAKETLAKVKRAQLLSANRGVGFQSVYAFRLLTAIAEKDAESFEAVLTDARSRGVYRIEALEQALPIYLAIENGQVVEEVPLLNDSHLYRILCTYFCAKNALNADKHELARAFFESIKDENPELFMVQEARAYLNKG